MRLIFLINECCFGNILTTFLDGFALRELYCPYNTHFQIRGGILHFGLLVEYCFE